MDLSKLKPIRPLLLIAAIAGFCVINIPFLYFSLFDRETYAAAMENGIAQVFMGEAFLLMLFIAFIIWKLEIRRPGWLFFIAMSLLGSMAFSIPFQLYLMSRPTSMQRKT